MAAPASDDWLTAPCGCQFGTVGDAFVFEPHDLACEIYLYARAESERQGKPFTILDAR